MEDFEIEIYIMIANQAEAAVLMGIGCTNSGCPRLASD
jgi:hypothetical protein